MKVKIKRIDKSLPIPGYQTEGACCFDLITREKTVIKPQTMALIPQNIIIQVPKNYMFIVVSRSSTPKKKGLLIPHGIGIIDNDYQGKQDEVLFQVYNFTDEVVVVEKGERIAQGCIVPIEKAEFEEIDMVSDKTRGGFGSTG